MKINSQIWYKAAFLMIVFSLNTFIGFACSMGLGLNTSHHKAESTEPSLHIHADCKKHQHKPKPVNPSLHIHEDGQKHEHKSKPATHHEENEIPTKDKDDCCADDVVQFQHLDKNLNQHISITMDAPVLIAMINRLPVIPIIKAITKTQLHSSRYLFPPPPDILISIHRFLI